MCDVFLVLFSVKQMDVIMHKKLALFTFLY